MMEKSDHATGLWPPPPGFVAVPSMVEGIELYAPAPEGKAEDTRTFRCPQCGGTVRYSPGENGLICPYCGFGQNLEVSRVGRHAREFEFTLETMARARYGWGEARRELVCGSCGAIVAVAPDALTSTCPFCGSQRVLAREPADDALRPTALVPFAIDREQLRALVVAWLGRGWMHPPELRNVRGLGELNGIYLPYWTFDTRVRATWRAEVGTEEIERYRQGGEWHTRTVLRWRWRSGAVERAVDDYFVTGTNRANRALLDGIAPFDLGSLVEYQQGCLAGWHAKGYDTPLEEAWTDAKRQIREAVRQACIEDTGSPHVRNLRMTADFDDERWRYVLLPVYLASYPFEGRTFQVMVNGQTGRIAGQKPVAWVRIWLAIALMLMPGACLGVVGLFTLPLGGAGVVGLTLGFILLVAGMVGAAVLFRKARATEEI